MLTIKSIPIEKLVPNEKQPRKEIEDGNYTIEALAYNIAEHGLLNPITVKELPDGNFLIVAGERRYRACIYLDLKTIGCVVINSDNISAVSIAENLARKDLTEVEKAKAIAEIRTQYDSNTALAKALGVSEGYIRKLLKVNELPDETKQDIRDKKITADQAVKVETKTTNAVEVDKSNITDKLKKPSIEDIGNNILEISIEAEQLVDRYKNIEDAKFEEKEQLYYDLSNFEEKYQNIYCEICCLKPYVQSLLATEYKNWNN